MDVLTLLGVAVGLMVVGVGVLLWICKSTVDFWDESMGRKQ